MPATPASLPATSERMSRLNRSGPFVPAPCRCATTTARDLAGPLRRSRPTVPRSRSRAQSGESAHAGLEPARPGRSASAPHPGGRRRLARTRALPGPGRKASRR